MPVPVNMYIKLQGDVATVLGRVSRRERRNPRDQAALYIEDGLRRAGALPVEVTSYRDVTDDVAGSPATSEVA
jgi:hypothetical protein